MANEYIAHYCYIYVCRKKEKITLVQLYFDHLYLCAQGVRYLYNNRQISRWQLYQKILSALSQKSIKYEKKIPLEHQKKPRVGNRLVMDHGMYQYI